MSIQTSDLRRALRLIQQADNLAGAFGNCGQHLREAEMSLGIVLGLECSSTDPDDHNGDTCPIHEWLVPADEELARPSEARS